MTKPSSAGVRLIKRVGHKPLLESLEKPVARKGEVLLRVLSVGLCRTDLLVADGRLPIERDVILGHEFSAVVEDLAADVSIPQIGKGTIVAVNPTFPMPSGRDGYIGVDADGALATWICLPADRLYPTNLAPRLAAYLEPIAAALGGLAPARQMGGRGAIVGSNRIATLTSLAFSSPSGTCEADGAPVEHDLISLDELEASPDQSYDWLLETRLCDRIITEAARVLKPDGILILKSRHLDGITIPIRDYVLKNLSLVGRTREDFGAAMSWLTANARLVEPLLGPERHISRWEDAFSLAETGEGNKVFVTLGEL